jgi:phage terminase Nu1 subunit (DNA packaging protein)
VTAEDRDLKWPEWRLESPLLLTRAQAAQLCQVSVEILDQWSYEPGFPVIRRSGGHLVRTHRAALERWLEQFAVGTTPGLV